LCARAAGSLGEKRCSAGEDFDPLLEKYIPGNLGIILKIMPSAGGMTRKAAEMSTNLSRSPALVTYLLNICMHLPAASCAQSDRLR
jgi:hypothetical protein